MGDLVLQAHCFGGALEVAGDDVPADAAFGEVIEGRHAAGEDVGRLVAEVRGDAEAEVGGGVGHGGDEEEGVVDWNLYGVADGWGRAVGEDVVDAEDVGEEEAVEEAAFEELGEADPVIEAGVAGGLVARVGP